MYEYNKSQYLPTLQYKIQLKVTYAGRKMSVITCSQLNYNWYNCDFLSTEIKQILLC
jgi:hypothetical protein